MHRLFPTPTALVWLLTLCAVCATGKYTNSLRGFVSQMTEKVSLYYQVRCRVLYTFSPYSRCMLEQVPHDSARFVYLRTLMSKYELYPHATTPPPPPTTPRPHTLPAHAHVEVRLELYCLDT